MTAATLPALKTDLAEVLAELERAPAAGDGPRFALPANLFHLAKARDRNARRGIRRLIRPENAAPLVDALPAGPEDRTHCVLRGDFVLCDLIPAIVRRHGPLGHVRIATLGLSTANAQSLAALVTAGRIAQLTLVVSHYFQQVDRTTTYREVAGELARIGARLAVTRNHAKILLLPFAVAPGFLTARAPLVIEGSANLRSSDNLEQIAIFADPELHDFHAAWIDQLAEVSAHA